MTTTVKISAHCSTTKKVEVIVREDGKDTEVFYLEDGESAERYSYDARVIIVQEIMKGDAP